MTRLYKYLLRSSAVLVGGTLLSSDGCAAGQVIETIFFAFRIVDVWV